jgi:lysine-specific histone demethylase 1
LIVLIVGGGIAGLTTARELHNIFLNQPRYAAPRILVLESRQRIGGRIFTFPLHCRWNDSKIHSYFDLGPWVVSDCLPVKHMVDQIGLEKEEYNPYDVSKLRLYDIDGSIVTLENRNAAQAFVNEIREKVEREMVYLRKMNKPYQSLPSVGQLFVNAIENHPLYKEFAPLHMRLIHWFLANIEAEYGVNIDDLSVYSPRMNRTREYKIPGGLGQLPHALAYGLTKDSQALEIFCDHRVEKLCLTGDGIDVVVNGHAWSADAIVNGI